MGQMLVYQYKIPLEETEDGFEPVYDYPEGNEHTRYEKSGNLIVIQDKAIPHFHKDSVSVKVDVLVEDDAEWENERP
jgi:hypothetical protein